MVKIRCFSTKNITNYYELLNKIKEKIELWHNKIKFRRDEIIWHHDSLTKSVVVRLDDPFIKYYIH